MDISLDTSVALATIFILSVFIGFEVISKVSVILHTPLMSGANAIHGIILVGAIIVTANAKSFAEVSFGLLAIVLATINLVGGFAVTERMLQMFKPRPKKPSQAEITGEVSGRPAPAEDPGKTPPNGETK